RREGRGPSAPSRGAHRAVRAGPHQAGPHLLQGQPAEGRAGRRALPGRGSVHHGRAHLGAGPADGGDLHRRGRAPEGRREDGAAVQPHPGRGREAVRHGDHHPRRPGRRVRHPRPAAPPHALHRGRHHERGHRAAGRAGRSPRSGGRGRSCALRRGRRGGPRRAPGARAHAGHRSHHHAAVPRGPLPASLRRRARVRRAHGAGRRAMTGTAHRATAGRTHRLDVRPASPLTGLGALVRLFGRISRRQILIWAVAMVVTVAASVIALKEAYPDQQALDARAALLGNPSAVLMTGPAFGREHYTLWAAVANELLLYVLLAGAIMSILLTVRHTRSEEEAGRLEMLRALPTGRLAPAAATLVVVAVADLALGAAVSLGVLSPGAPVADGIALGAASALTGLVFCAIAAVAAQLTEHAGTASGLSLGALAVAFLVRGVGDVIAAEGSWLSWFSPLAWAQQTTAFVDLRWWPLALSAGAIVLLLALAAQLSRRRDLGSGLRPAAPGPATASAALRAPGGLARRLVTPMMLTWTIGLFLFAIAFGSLASSLEDMVDQIPTIGEFAPIDVDDLTTSFTAYILLMLALGPVGLIVA